MYFPEAYAPYGNMPSVRDRAAAMDMPIGQRIPINGGCHDFYQGIAPGAALINSIELFSENGIASAMQFLRFASRIARDGGVSHKVIGYVNLLFRWPLDLSGV